MNRFFEYVTHHPFLVAAAAILAVLALVFEFRQRARGSSAVAPADAVRLANSGRCCSTCATARNTSRPHHRGAPTCRPPSSPPRRDAEEVQGKPVIVYCESGDGLGAAARTLRAGWLHQR
jgi:hypothetical protein